MPQIRYLSIGILCFASLLISILSGCGVNPATQEFAAAQAMQNPGDPQAAITAVQGFADSEKNAIRSPHKGDIGSAVTASKDSNETWQTLAIVVPIITPFAAGGALLVRSVAAIAGGVIGYKATKGAPATEVQECEDLSNALADIDKFRSSWILAFTLDEKHANPVVTDQEWLAMVNEANKLDQEVRPLNNVCMD